MRYFSLRVLPSSALDQTQRELNNLISLAKPPLNTSLTNGSNTKSCQDMENGLNSRLANFKWADSILILAPKISRN